MTKEKINIGIQTIDNVAADEADEKKSKQKLTKEDSIFKDPSKYLIEADLEKQITTLMKGRNNYMTLAKMAAQYKMNAKKFREYCFEDNELSNLLIIYNSVYLEHIMDQAIKSGKINSQVEDFLKNEMQAFTGSGFEQNIHWVLDESKLKLRDTNEEFTIEVDVDRNTQEENEAKIWEVNNEGNKE